MKFQCKKQFLSLLKNELFGNKRISQLKDEKKNSRYITFAKFRSLFINISKRYWQYQFYNLPFQSFNNKYKKILKQDKKKKKRIG